MTDPTPQTNLPAQISEAVAGIPKALVPACLKALDRLVGAAVDIPVAWLAQQKAKIDAQTQAYKLVEESIAKAAATEVCADKETVQRAVDVLVRKSYRKQVNREAVATAMLEDLAAKSDDGAQDAVSTSTENLDEDWLNVFERYAEDASTERMQKLWGRVLAGEVRKPGRYSMRTLRFLSEFSQADALLFADFCNSAFSDIAPNKLVNPPGEKDIRALVNLESAGLITRGLSQTRRFNSGGHSILIEGDLAIVLQGEPNKEVKTAACVLTPLGQELITLLPGRDVKAAARAVANAIRTPEVRSAYLGTIARPTGQVLAMEILWQKEENATVG